MPPRAAASSKVAPSSQKASTDIPSSPSPSPASVNTQAPKTPTPKGKAPAVSTSASSSTSVLDVEMDDNISSGTLSGASSPVHNNAVLRNPEGLDYSAVELADRLSSGFYDFVVKRIDTLGLHALSNIEPARDLSFERGTNQWRIRGQANKEMVVHLVGEIATAKMKAYGNKPEGKEINDGVNVRGLVTLQEPTGWDADKLDGAMLVKDEIWALQECVKMAEGGERAFKDAIQRTANDPRFKLVMPGKKSALEVEGYDQIPVVTEMFYTTKSPVTVIEAEVERSPRKRKVVDQTPATISTSVVAAARIPAVGDLHDPKLMPGYNTLDFKHAESKLIQLDVRDINGRLLLPWEWHEYLTPKTLVTVRAKLKRWVMAPGNKNNMVRSHIYQVVAESIRVLAKGEPSDGATSSSQENNAETVSFDEDTVYLEDYDVLDPFAIPGTRKRAKNE
ncbi:hypothetical protein EXIGLDRAFT_763282 [Exidia glandulosa HHB12029]|uniref:Uncharacterized protein n=1 Tax=Exidia glandulosa HHB12029 TaxID=1314781 RepID=A0A165M638_EXIGL|nr:hypothetical protein EXIGLDRAFT_763282 [Exidia glandulosa HHB12029]